MDCKTNSNTYTTTFEVVVTLSLSWCLMPIVMVTEFNRLTLIIRINKSNFYLKFNLIIIVIVKLTLIVINLSLKLNLKWPRHNFMKIAWSNTRPSDSQWQVGGDCVQWFVHLSLEFGQHEVMTIMICVPIHYDIDYIYSYTNTATALWSTLSQCPPPPQKPPSNSIQNQFECEPNTNSN